MLAGCIVAVTASRLGGQSATHTPRSTLDGVYTAEQAKQGENLYQGRCRSCHTPSAHVVNFKSYWAGHPLSEPFGYVQDNMPKDNPGTLSDDETAQVLAYFLSLLGMPAGSQGLPADPEALTEVRIDTLATESRHS